MPKFICNVFFGGLGGATLMGDFGLAIARVASGLMLAIGHGFGKLWGEHGFGPHPMLVEGVSDMGLPMPTVMAWLATLAESVFACLLALGLFTRPVALVLVINMSVAAFIAHGKDPVFFTGAGPAKEMALLYLIPFVLFLFAGGGRFSIDRLIRGGAKREFPVEPK